MKATINKIAAAPVMDQKRNASGVTPISPAYFAKLVERPIRPPPPNKQAKGMSHVLVLREACCSKDSLINYPIGW